MKGILIKSGKYFIICFILFLFFNYFIFTISNVTGDSMAPTILDNQWIITNRASYLFNQPKRGDIVVIELADKTYIKRVIGLPNETLNITDQQLIINDIPYSQTFLTDDRSFWTHDVPNTLIPDGHYYVIGDHRRLSRDSRNSLGFINQADIIGRAEFIVYPFSDWQVIY
ncbi:signal peptidase I [Amphibacillus marinus]|uniref:Signal peptidase I n=1 Tax=Amphibacillus marinus TaxID=872970 RepID=A0A1H8ICV7_9BACI|nr:signal peptidase I [Amphibacillus marinus]SEN65638.1 signal peptidase I [Amphibacillus marinus]